MGQEKLFCFPPRLLCLLPELAEIGLTRSGDRRSWLRGGGPGCLIVRRLTSAQEGLVRGPPTSRRHRTAGGQHVYRGFPGYYEVILFLSILGKNSKYKMILIKVKIHHLDCVIVL